MACISKIYVALLLNVRQQTGRYRHGMTLLASHSQNKSLGGKRGLSFSHRRFIMGSLVILRKCESWVQGKNERVMFRLVSRMFRLVSALKSQSIISIIKIVSQFQADESAVRWVLFWKFQENPLNTPFWK